MKTKIILLTASILAVSTFSSCQKKDAAMNDKIEKLKTEAAVKAEIAEKQLDLAIAEVKAGVTHDTAPSVIEATNSASAAIKVVPDVKPAKAPAIEPIKPVEPAKVTTPKTAESPKKQDPKPVSEKKADTVAEVKPATTSVTPAASIGSGVTTVVQDQAAKIADTLGKGGAEAK
jgi:hypothetical protein